MSKRVHVTIPTEFEGLLSWYVQHDDRFKDKEAAAVAHFFALGIRAAYEEGLRTAEPLSSDEFAPLAKQQARTFKTAGESSEG